MRASFTFKIIIQYDVNLNIWIFYFIYLLYKSNFIQYKNVNSCIYGLFCLYRSQQIEEGHVNMNGWVIRSIVVPVAVVFNLALAALSMTLLTGIVAV